MTDFTGPLAFEEWEMSEISPVDLPAQTPAVETIIKRHDGELGDPPAKEITKRIHLTTATDGHQHTIDDTFAEDGGHTSYDRGPDDESGHSHGWVRDPDGSITIALSDGHTHTIRQTEVIAVTARFENRKFGSEEREKLGKEKKALPDGSFPIVTRQDLRNAIQAFGRAKSKAPVAKHIKARARALGATDLLPSEGMLAVEKAEGRSAGDAGDEYDKDKRKKKEGSMSNPEGKAADTDVTKAAEEQATKILDLEKRLAEQTALAALTDPEKTFLKALPEDKRSAFLTAAPAARTQQIQKVADANTVEYTSDSGEVFRKNDDPRLVMLAKRGDEDRRIAKAEREKRENLELEKRATEEIGTLPGTDAEKVALLKAVGDIKDEEVRGKVEKMLQAQSVEMGKAFKKLGTVAAPEGPDGASAEAKLEKMAVEKAKADGIPIEKARDEVLQTEEGGRVYAEYLEENPAQTAPLA